MDVPVLEQKLEQKYSSYISDLSIWYICYSMKKVIITQHIWNQCEMMYNIKKSSKRIQFEISWIYLFVRKNHTSIKLDWQTFLCHNIPPSIYIYIYIFLATECLWKRKCQLHYLDLIFRLYMITCYMNRINYSLNEWKLIDICILKVQYVRIEENANARTDQIAFFECFCFVIDHRSGERSCRT